MRFGLIGKNLIHSFSKDFFNNKFEILKLKNYQYQNFEINNVKEIINIINKTFFLKNPHEFQYEVDHFQEHIQGII